MVLLLIFASLFLSVQAGLLDNEKQILATFKSKYNNSQSDLIFLMDISWSVKPYGWKSEKIFVESLLNEFSIAPYSTRVAVLTFGNVVKTDINYLDIDPGDVYKNKCEFKPLFNNRVGRHDGTRTDMQKAFRQTMEVLKRTIANGRKRLNVHTVTMMITDGGWNPSDPTNEANSLKSTYNSELFMVGVDDYKLWQLQKLASSYQHVLKFSDFTKFRQLASYIRGDAHNRVYMEMPKTPSKCTSSSGCDSNAFCACGTVSGIYQCVCREGYYGPATPNACYPCHKGTYKSYPSPELCDPCPGNSTTATVGSKTIHDCQCLGGFEGNPAARIPCLPVRCGTLSAPVNGRLVAPCTDVYRSQCEFKCNEGYNLKGTPSRTCQKTKQWSGIETTCHIVQCAALPVVTHGQKSCTGGGRYYGNACSYTCDVGYELRGSTRRVCQKDGTWSGRQASCQAKLCPALRKLAFGTVEPVDCLTTPQPYQRACVMRCVKGYDFSGDSPLTCGPDGQWIGTFPSCKDNRPPVITCPASVTGNTDPERPTKQVEWDAPTAQDNAELHDANAAPTITSSHPLITSPHNFPIGTSRITFTATDKSDHTASCTFTVTITDNEPPFIFCPENIELMKSSQFTPVHWKPPHYFDNSRGKVTLFTASTNGTGLAEGTHTIRYTATDLANNVGKCSFLVAITKTRCKAYDPPINGAMGCNTFGSSTYCNPACNDNYDFSRIPAMTYSCTNGIWNPFDYRPNVERIMPWPDCTDLFDPNAMKGMHWQYFTGDCNKPETQTQIKKKFITMVTTIIGGGDPGYCEREQACNLEDIKVTCGKVQSRRRRSTGYTNEVTIGFKLDVTSKGKTFTEREQLLNTYVNQIKAQRTGSMQSLNVPGMSSQFYRISQEDSAVHRVCKNGSVEGLKDDANTGNKCQSCPNGFYYDSSKGSCAKCAINTYTDKIGSLQCKKCPAGFFTFADGSRKFGDCQLPCSRGTISPTGLGNCRACALGYYQPDKKQTSCRKCPGSTITLDEGANSVQKCGMPCAPGTISKTGVEPCDPCPVGSYQPSRTKTECLSCPDPKTTFGKGSVQLSQCVVINFCGSNPCINNGACSNKVDGYVCQCVSGFTGKHCEIEEDECSSSPCAQGATCIDKIDSYMCQCPSGYTGKHCDTKVAECKQGLCLNSGKCIENPNGFECACVDGYEGAFCEVNTNECKSTPCRNGGTCTDGVNKYSCACATGYSGEQCEEKTNGCQHDSCVNGATCHETSYGHRCACAQGFSGLRCEVDVNECASSPCANNGYCVDKKGSFSCLCRPGYSGLTCTTVGSSDFDLVFERSKGRSMSAVESRSELRAFTISFWMKATGSDVDPGTPISYAVESDGTLFDNALTIHDYNAFNIWINNEKASTDVPANDGKWHHMAFTWESRTGAWAVYKDGAHVRSSTTPLQKDKSIAAGGLFVLAQEQDIVGGNFSANEAFMGHMSQMNVWNYKLDAAEIIQMGRHSHHRQGNLIAWSDFLLKLDSNIVKVQPSASRTQNKCWTNWVDRYDPSSSGESEPATPGACAGSASYDCQTLDGFGVEDVDLTVQCTSNGFTCLNDKQTCVDFKFRAVCNCPANTACSTNPCRNSGACVSLPVGYRCNCPTGFDGRNCEKALNCPNPGPIGHGRVTLSSSAQSGTYVPGTVASFSCNSGFMRNGASRLTCRNGRWQGAIPQCNDINECNLNKCQHSCENYDGGYQCACAKGYALQADGTCRDIDECATNKGGCQHGCYNSQGSYRCSCSSGYTLLADNHACQDVNECSANQGRGSCQQICVNSLGSFSCQCRSGFVLDSAGRTCRAITCPRLSAPANGRRAPDQDLTTLDSELRFTCNDGFKLKGSDTRTCQSDGQWSGVTTTCAGVQCVVPQAPPHCTMSKSGSGYNSALVYSCNSGYHLSGNARRTCGTDGLWSGEQPRCIAANCPDPSAPAHGSVVGLQRDVDDTVRYECDEGYHLHGSSYSICLQSGAWSNPTPSCQIINCGPPPALARGHIAGSVYIYGSKIQYSCIQDWHLSGPTERTCQGNGLWSGKHPTCLERSCGDPGDVTNGIKTGDDFTYGKVVRFACTSGYLLSGSASRTCQTTGKWTGTQPTCNALSCGDPGTPVNGERQGSTFTFSSVLRYDCMPGYKLVGNRQRTCGSDARWTGTQPRCDVANCGALKVGPSGTIKSENYPNSYSDNAYCRWKISVRSDKKVMLKFASNSFQTQAGKDKVEIYDGKTGELITELSGINNKPFQITSNSNIMDVRFTSDGSSTAQGFQATYEQVDCGGFVNQLDSVIASPNYPQNYPPNSFCVWVINIKQAFQLEFDSFHTDTGYDYLRGYKDYTQTDRPVFDLEDQWLHISPIQSTTGKMLLKFYSNGYNQYKGFQLKVRRYQVIVGKKR